MSASPEPLQDYRDRIDAIDDQLIALLRERCGIVKEVGQYKAANETHYCYIRPGREAIMTRDIVTQDAGGFPKPMLAAIWRMLIAGSTSLEQALSASVFGDNSHRDFFWLAHEYFGPVATITMQGTAGRVIGDVADKKAMVGFIPMPQDDEDHWWRSLVSNRDHWPQVFGIAPFLADDRLPSALLIGDIQPEDTGDDISLLVLESSEPLSRDKQHSVMQEAGFESTCLTQSPSSEDPGLYQYAIAVEGFIPRDSGKLTEIQKAYGAPVQRVSSIGSYARQLEVE